eukprot:831127-Pleurochrysis_carterae.AAC.1
MVRGLSSAPLLVVLAAARASAFEQSERMPQHPYPQYSGRTLTPLVNWRFGLLELPFDSLAHMSKDELDRIPTPKDVVVPHAFDVAQPGVRGPRTAALYRTTVKLQPHGRKACASAFGIDCWTEDAPRGTASLLISIGYEEENVESAEEK